MLKQPRPQDVGSHFGEDASFLLVLLPVGVVVFLPSALSGADTRVTGVA